MPPSFGTSGAKPEPTRLRQIALVVEDLQNAKQTLTRILGVDVCYEDPGVAQWGLENFLSGDIIEVVSPTRPGTTAGRLLSKRGDGGYMIIMQNLDAGARRSYIESSGLGKVIWGYHHHDDEADGTGDATTCVQYHPKGIKGGMMPELDSHAPTKSNPDPLKNRFSPWHACGQNYTAYSRIMKDAGHLQLQGALLRLAPGDVDTEAASRQWESIFGVGMSRDLLAFTNARMGFVRGVEGKPEGLESITIAVEGGEHFDGILARANEAGLCGKGWINMCGVKWYLTYSGGGQQPSKL